MVGRFFVFREALFLAILEKYIGKCNFGEILFHKDTIDGEDEADRSGEMVLVKGFVLEEKQGEAGKDDQGDNLLNDLELHEGKGPSVLVKANAVGRYLKAIFEEGDSPRKEDDPEEGPVGDDFHLLQFQMTVPGECHEDIRHNEQQDGVNALHDKEFFRNQDSEE